MSPDELESVAIQSAHLGGLAFGWSPVHGLEVSAGLPLMLLDARFGRSNRACGAGAEGITGNTLGLNDPELRIRWQAFEVGLFRITLRGALRVPVASAAGGVEAALLFGDPLGSAQLGGTAGLDFDAVQLVFDAALTLRPQPGEIPVGRFGRLFVGDELTFGAGVLMRLPWGFQSVVEINGRFAEVTGPDDSLRDFQLPLEALIGLRYSWDSLDVQLGAGGGLSDGYGTPSHRILTSVRYRGDGLYPFQWLRGLQSIQPALEELTSRARATRVPIEEPRADAPRPSADDCPDPNSEEAAVVVVPGCPDSPRGTRSEIEVGDEEPVSDVLDDVSREASLAASRERVVILYVSFEHDSDVPGPGDAAQLQRELAAAPGGARLVAVTIDAHADKTGADAYNDVLAAKRAQAIVAILVSAGVARSIIEPRSVGSREELVPGLHPVNRRARIALHYRVGVEQQGVE